MFCRNILAVSCCLWCSVVAKEVVSLRGAGASFPYEVYKRWIASYKTYRADFVDLDMSYQAVGSGTGKSWFKEKTIPLEYAGSDSVLSDQDYVDDPDLQMFPTMAGAVVLGYNIPGVQKLRLTRDMIVGIYNGSYTFWDDSVIQQANPGVDLPAQRILVMARADKSGTTGIFTKALSSFSSQWAVTYGHFSNGLNSDYQPYHWNKNVISYYGKSTLGVRGMLLSMRYAIGYLSLADAKQSHITYASIINKAGSETIASPQAIQSAMDDFLDGLDEHVVVDLVDGPGQSSYPIAGYTYMIIRTNSITNCSSAIALLRYIDWFLQEPDARIICEELDFVPLSAKMSQKVHDSVLLAMNCNTRSLSILAEDQESAEIRSQQAWRKIVPIAVPIGVIVLLAFSTYIVVQQIHINRAVLRNEWKISLNRLRFITLRALSQHLSRKSLHSASATSTVNKNPSIGLGLSAENIAVMDDDQHVMVTEMNLSNTKTLKLRTRKAIIWMKDKVDNINVSKFFGLCEKEGSMYCLETYPRKGALRDVLQDEKYNLDVNFQYSMACDIVNGMMYLVKQHLIHGNLSSQVCYLDERWTVKIGDWQFTQLSVMERDCSINRKQADEPNDENTVARTKFWMSPELLKNPPSEPTKEVDIYSLAVILVEIFSRADPYEDMESEPKDIIKAIMNDELRPEIPDNMHPQLVPIIQKSWSSDPDKRPSLIKIKNKLDGTKPSKKSVMDCMMEAMESYVDLLEDKVAERTQALEIAIQQSTDLLNKMLPPQIARRLASNEAIDPELYESVTIFFSDIVGFTKLSSESKPIEIVAMLNDLYTTFDEVVDQHDVYKVETIGDAYMVISGAPERNGNLHAAHVASMALGLASASKTFLIRHRPEKSLEYRAGIHSGSACTGVVGIKMPRYCIFGDTVNTASRMESTSIARMIQVSGSTKKILDNIGGFTLESRGEVSMKGKGVMETYWLTGKDTSINMET